MALALFPRWLTLALSAAAGLAALTLLVRWVEPRLAFFPFAGESVTPARRRRAVPRRDDRDQRRRASPALASRARRTGRARRVLPRQRRQSVALVGHPGRALARRVRGGRVRLPRLRTEHRPSVGEGPLSRRRRGPGVRARSRARAQRRTDDLLGTLARHTDRRVRRVRATAGRHRARSRLPVDAGACSRPIR